MSPLNENQKNEIAAAAQDAILRKGAGATITSESGIRFTVTQFFSALAVVVLATLWIFNYAASLHKEIDKLSDSVHALATQNEELKTLIRANRFTSKDWDKAVWIADQRVAKGKPYSLPYKEQIDSYHGWTPSDVPDTDP